MTHTNDFSPYDPDALPPVVVRYLDAQADRGKRKLVADQFAQHARVVDEGIEYSGLDAIRGWLANAASEYSYITTFIGQRRGDADHWVVLARLEGNFPGGVAELRFQFTVQDDRIGDLVIAP